MERQDGFLSRLTSKKLEKASKKRAFLSVASLSSLISSLKSLFSQAFFLGIHTLLIYMNRGGPHTRIVPTCGVSSIH